MKGSSWRRKLAGPFRDFLAFLKQGATPLTLARSAALGWTLGCCPLLGASSGVTLLTVWLSCGFFHLPMTILANFCALPIELALIVPFMRLGEVLCGKPHMDVAPMNVLDVINHAPKEALRSIGHALLGWAVVLLPAACLVTAVLYPLFELARQRMERSSGDRALVKLHAQVNDNRGSEGEDPFIPHATKVATVPKP